MKPQNSAFAGTFCDAISSPRTTAKPIIMQLGMRIEARSVRIRLGGWGCNSLPPFSIICPDSNFALLPQAVLIT
jgi:hypothetical protein